MERCDVCGLPRQGSRVSTGDVHEAVKKGFDPVHLNLLPKGTESSGGHARTCEAWELALQSETDWEICSDCLQHLGPYLPFATRNRLGLTPGKSGRHSPDELMSMVEEKMRARGWTPEMKEAATGSLKASIERKSAAEKKGCFIATAACGPDAPEVQTLRFFRDTVLVDHRAGRAFIGGYARFSPSLARWIEPWTTARWLVRTLLVRPVAWLVSWLVSWLVERRKR